MEHTLHLASKAFIEEICPTPSRYKKKKPQKAEEDDEFEEDDEEWDGKPNQPAENEHFLTSDAFRSPCREKVADGLGHPETDNEGNNRGL